MPQRVLHRLVKPSTRAFWKESLARPGGSFSESLHGWLYMCWPGLYIQLGLGRSPGARRLGVPAAALARFFGLWSTDGAARFADTYHGKAMPPEHISLLITVGRAVEMTVPENVLPYSKARDILLHNPEELVLFNCPCRETVENPCLPLDVCIIVGKPFTDFILEHHPGKSRRIDTETALDVVRGAHKRGHVSHAFFKEALMGRYYAICNCCSCCCGAMQAQRQGGAHAGLIRLYRQSGGRTLYRLRQMQPRLPVFRHPHGSGKRRRSGLGAY